MKQSNTYLERHRFVPWMLLITSLTATVLVWYAVNEVISQNIQTRFEQKVSEIESAIVERLSDYEQIMRGTQGLFAASIEVNRDEWREYVVFQKTQERFPGIQALGYSQVIGSPENLPEHLEKIRNEGFSDYTVHPMTEKNEYHAIIYIEPMDEENLLTLGLDMSFEENRHNAMKQARDSGETTLTRKITLIQETGENVQSGFLMFMPIYQNGVPVDTVSQRKDAIQGYVYGAFRMDDLMTGILGKTFSDIAYKIYDSDIKAQNIMFESELHKDILYGETQLFKTSNIFFGEQKWIVEYYTTGSFITGVENIIPIFTIIVGLTISGMLFYTTNSFNQSRKRIEMLTEATNKFSEEMDVYIDSSLKNSKYETANLARAFEKMQKSISSKNKQLEENLRELEKINVLKEEFGAMISHELKTPLSPIIGWCDVLLDKEISGALTDSQRESVFTIRENALKLLALIGDMLDTQMIESGRMKFDKNNFKISELFGRIQKNYQNRLDDKVKLVFSNHNGLTIYSDERRIEQVISNLINNSLSFISKEDGVIDVSVEDDNYSVLFSVRDNGKGIPEEFQNKIFDKFYQTDTSERRKHGGVGLGLAISKGIVEGLGGKIWFKNGEDSGCNICFNIPKGNLN